jgi:mannose-6-phosphate isomerase-like protein (cupin superfamily)
MNKITLTDEIKRVWGENCFAYELLEQPNLHIHHEIMQPNTSESKHYHINKNQYFYCLDGQLTIEVDNKIFKLNKFEGLYVRAMQPHIAKNLENNTICFLVISDNNVADRVEVAYNL